MRNRNGVNVARRPVVGLAILGLLIGGCATPNDPGGGVRPRPYAPTAGPAARPFPTAAPDVSLRMSTADDADDGDAPNAVDPLTCERLVVATRRSVMIALSILHGHETPLPPSIAEGMGELAVSPLMSAICAISEPTAALVGVAVAGGTTCAAGVTSLQTPESLSDSARRP